MNNKIKSIGLVFFFSLFLILSSLVVCAEDYQTLSYHSTDVDFNMEVDRDYMDDLGHTWGELTSGVHSSSPNKVAIDTDTYPELNITAEITFKGTCYNNPIVFHNDVWYETATISKGSGCEYTFIAPYWSEWTITENVWNGTHYQTTISPEGLGLDWMNVATYHFTESTSYQVDNSTFANDFNSTEFTNVNGYSGKGIYLNGSQVISINNDTELNEDLEESFTIVARIKLSSNKTNTIVGYSGAWADRNFQFKTNVANELQLHITDGGSTQVVSHSTPLTLDEWTFVAVSYDFGVNNILLQVNADEDNFAITTPLQISNKVMAIGGLVGGSDTFNGTIDELYIYREYLNSTQIGEFLIDPPYMLGDENVYYTFNENGGHLTNIIDYGALGVDGTSFYGSRSSDAKYGFSREMIFGTNSEVHTDAHPHLFSDANDSMTNCIWTKSQNGTSNAQALMSQFDYGNSTRQWLMNGNGKSEYIKYRLAENGNQTLYKEILGSIPVFDNEWHLICGTFGNGDIKLYVDGVEDAGVTIVRNDSFYALNTTFTPDERICIGCLYNNGGPANDYHGLVDEYRSWNRELSLEEINLLYQNTRSNFFKHYTEGNYTSEPYCADTYDTSAYWNIWLNSVFQNDTGILQMLYKAGNLSDLPSYSYSNASYLGSGNYSFSEQEGMCVQVVLDIENPDVESEPIYYPNMTLTAYKIYEPYLVNWEIFPDNITAIDMIYANATFLFNDSMDDCNGMIEYEWWVNGVLDHLTSTNEVIVNGTEVLTEWNGTYTVGDVVYARFHPGIGCGYGDHWGDWYQSENVTTLNSPFNATFTPLNTSITLTQPRKMHFSYEITYDPDGDVVSEWYINGILQNFTNVTLFTLDSRDYYPYDLVVIEVILEDTVDTISQTWNIEILEGDSNGLVMIPVIMFIMGLMGLFAFCTWYFENGLKFAFLLLTGLSTVFGIAMIANFAQYLDVVVEDALWKVFTISLILFFALIIYVVWTMFKVLMKTRPKKENLDDPSPERIER